jgi:hypothetical protein
MADQCTGCKYWEVVPLDNLDLHGECHRHPPTTSYKLAYKNLAAQAGIFPITRFDNYCGDFKKEKK